MTPDELYEKDFYAWALQQADALRRLPAAAGVDSAHLAEEIEDLGGSQLRTVVSQLRNLLAHLLKVAHSGNPQVVGHWRKECRAFLFDARDHYTPSMRQRLDLDALFQQARQMAEDDFADAGEPPARMARHCPFTLAELLDTDFNLDNAIERLRSANH